MFSQEFENELSHKIIDRIGELFNKSSNDKSVLTGAEAYEYLRISKPTLASLVKKGVIPYFMLGDLKRYRKSELSNIGK